MPSRTPWYRSSAAQRLVTGVLAGGLLLTAACSSDSEPTASPVDVDAETDGPGASDEDSSGGDGSSPAESSAGAEVATAPVCDLITPFVDDVVAAFGADLPLAEDSPSGRLESGCTLDLLDPEPGIDRGDAAIIEVARHPALYTDVASTAEQTDLGGSTSEASSVGGDALLLTDATGEVVMVFFSSGGRVWSVKGNWAVEGAPDGHVLDEAMTEVARVVRAGLEATG